MMRTILVLVTLIVVIQATITTTSQHQWNTFKARHQKQYKSSIEEQRRYEIFASNIEQIRKHNARYAQGLVSYKMGVNQFTDLTTEEINSRYNGYKAAPRKLNDANRLIYKASGDDDLPESFDWRDIGAVTPVKNQASCGSCWSFSATGAIEGQLYLLSGNLTSISEQNLVDCSKNGGNEGCNGGYQQPAFQYVIDNGGINTEEAYPYEGVDGECRYVAEASATSLTAYAEIEFGVETDLQDAVVKIGPIAVAIDASKPGFHGYVEGVYYEEDCLTGENDIDDLDHAVLVVGYGVDEASGTDYWLVKNSWDTTWGDQGYIRMARNRDNNCGIASDASYPII